MTEPSNDAKPSGEGEMMHGHFDVQKWPFYWLTKAYGRYISEMELSLKEVELDIPRWRVLMLDQRVTEALLTVNGRRARLLALQKADDIYKRALGTLPNADIDALNTSLSKIYTNLE